MPRLKQRDKTIFKQFQESIGSHPPVAFAIGLTMNSIANI